jgi:hypothetical protein
MGGTFAHLFITVTTQTRMESPHTWTGSCCRDLDTLVLLEKADDDRETECGLGVPVGVDLPVGPKSDQRDHILAVSVLEVFLRLHSSTSISTVE